VFDLVKKSSEEESPKLTEPNTEQEEEVGDVEEEEEESTTEENTKVDNEGTRSRALKRLSHEMRNLHTFYNLTLEELGNSDHAKFLSVSSRNQVKELDTFNEAWFHNNPEEKMVGEMLLKKD
jgi:hypothetical protein